MILIRQRPMPPMIVGHPGLGEPDWLYPHGGRTGLFYVPWEVSFSGDDGVDDDDEFDEFTYELMLALSQPIGASSWAKPCAEWMAENDPAWPPDSRPSAVRNSLQCHPSVIG